VCFSHGTDRDKEAMMSRKTLSRSAARVGAGALGRLAAGAVALGALAIGALAIGRLAIRRLAVKESRVGKLEIDELVIGQLRIRDTGGLNVSASVPARPTTRFLAAAKKLPLSSQAQSGKAIFKDAGCLSEEEVGFLHDGSAKTIQEAILRHGAEAAVSRAKFSALTTGQVNALLAYLRSI
jgi:hypothetical protein